MEIKRLILVVLACLFLIFSGYFYFQKALSFRFVDEEYNFAIGKYLKKGETLYQDIITNHQPLTHILSYQVQRFTNPNSTYLLIKRHRQAVAVWAGIWSLLLVWYFGAGALVFVLLFELTKIYLLGNVFLAESLVVYPTLFLIGLTFFGTRRLNQIELIFWGLCFGLVLFSLSPIWPLLGFLMIKIMLAHKENFFKSISLIFAGFFIIILLVLNFTSISGFFYYGLFSNLFYTIPSYHSENWILTVLKSFASPFLSFLPGAATPSLWVIRILSFTLLVNLLRKNNLKKILTIFIILGLANIRFVWPGTQGYTGFHILPWYAALIFTSSMLIFLSLKKEGLNFFSITGLVLAFWAVVLSLNFARGDLFSKTNPPYDYLINYSTHTTLGEAVRIMENDQDTLFVSPDAWLIYWQSGAHHLPKLYGYYTWMAGVPFLHQSVLQAFDKNPPTFFYCENCKGLDLEKYLSKYKQIKKAGGVTELYALLEKIKSLTLQQKNQLNYHKFSFD